MCDPFEVCFSIVMTLRVGFTVREVLVGGSPTPYKHCSTRGKSPKRSQVQLTWRRGFEGPLPRVIQGPSNFKLASLHALVAILKIVIASKACLHATIAVDWMTAVCVHEIG